MNQLVSKLLKTGRIIPLPRHHMPDQLDEARIEMKRQLVALRSANLLPRDRKVSRGGFILKKI